MEQFTFDGKALTSTELEDGSMLLDGFAVIFAGLDRTSENFAPGCLRRACKAFLEGSAPLCFHHRTGDVLGKVLEMSEVPGVGIRVKARVDGAIKNHPTLGTLYAQIKNGTLTGLSLGGYFKRLGNKIIDVDPTELSITGVPTHARPAFAVVEGKALQLASVEYDRGNLEWLRDQLQVREDELADLTYAVNRIQLGIRSRSQSQESGHPGRLPIPSVARRASEGKKPHFAEILLSEAASRRFTGLGSPTRAEGSRSSRSLHIRRCRSLRGKGQAISLQRAPARQVRAVCCPEAPLRVA